MAVEFFFILLVAGLLLVGAEIFVPGGILGSIGALALLGAVVFGFLAFPGYGGWIAVGIVLSVAAAIVLWVRIFPGTRAGRSLTVSSDLADAKATNPGMRDLVGQEGVTVSALRPGGLATLDGRRVDVITRGEMIGVGEPIVVVGVESNRVIVKQAHKQEEA